jgi:ribosomal protein S18 acetylase RimI-like enzyme
LRRRPGWGSLSERGRRNIAQMLRGGASTPTSSVWWPPRVGESSRYTLGRVSGDPLLPGLAGELDDPHVAPDAPDRSIGRRLAETVIARLPDVGAEVIWTHVDTDDEKAQAFWAALGFKRDMVRFSLYPESAISSCDGLAWLRHSRGPQHCGAESLASP